MKFKLKLRDIPLIAYIISIFLGLAFLLVPTKPLVKINNHKYPLVEYKKLPTGKYYVVYQTPNGYNSTYLTNLTIVQPSKIKFGIDIAGGKRVILEVNGTKEDVEAVYSVLETRLNSLGISDVRIYKSGKYIIVEFPPQLENKLKELLREGKFEAKIGNVTVFTGKDIIRVCLSPTCSGVDFKTCHQLPSGEWVCRYYFAVWLDNKAAQRFANVTKNLKVVYEHGQPVLNETINFYLDNKLVTNLTIDASLKGKAATEVSITGTGIGRTKLDAIRDAYERMKFLQTILLSGSFPVKPKIVAEEEITPILGKGFISNVYLDFLLALAGVTLFIFTRYFITERKLTIALLVTLLLALFLSSEIFLILVVAALINWVLDVASIAGILLTVGTGVDYLVIATDELLSKEKKTTKEKIKEAMQFIFRAFTTTALSLIALLFAAASLLRGFVITTLIGLVIGAFITRPAYVRALERMLNWLEQKAKR